MAERVVLAYSGGLDTSVGIGWLKDATGKEVRRANTMTRTISPARAGSTMLTAKPESIGSNP